MLSNSIFGGAARALSSPLFRRYWGGHLVASTGRWMYRMAVGWLAWELTQSSAWLGLIAFTDLAPTVFLTLVAGAVADRWGLMRIIRASLAANTILALILGMLVILDHLTIEGLLLIALAKGCADSFGQPARLAVVNALVPRRDLSSAIALGSVSFNASRVIGPGIAGLLIVGTGTGVVILICALMFLYFLIVVSTIHVDGGASASRSHSGEGGKSLGLITEVRDGITYAMAHPGIRLVMVLLAATSLLIRPVVELLPAIVSQVYRSGPAGLSLILASIGIGAVLASLLLARRGETAGLSHVLVFSALATSIALALSMQFANILIAAVFFGILGVFTLAGSVSAQTLVQNSVSREMRARTLGLFLVFGHGLPAIGALVQGWIADYLGLQATITAGALMMLAAWAWAVPRRRNVAKDLEKNEDAS